MRPDDWNSLKYLLSDLALASQGERSSRLASLDLPASQIDELRDLLAVDERAGDFLTVPAGGLASGIFDHDNGAGVSLIGERVGPFEIISELGSGGMGTVYLAERRDGKFEQKVALKVLRSDFDTPDVRQAFTREIDIQARLVHPDIAKVLDTGTTQAGTPFIAMEYIDGIPIDRYCAENKLTVTERLKLFNRACRAVSFAHSNLIIHRDLKSSNILVTPDGQPKLLDFGIAELSGRGGSDPITAMTPRFASPEQLAGGRITTAADIYSLGVILFKLLTGDYPEKGDAAADARRASISRDLAAIVRKALAADPADRYLTADDLSRDIWDLIDRKPVSAVPQTRRYRLRKFVARRRLAVAAGVIIALSLIGGSAAAMWQARAAGIEAEKAKESLSKAEKVSKFMYRVLSYAHPAWYAEGYRSQGQARVIDVMLELSDKIDAEFADDPDIAAEMHHKFGEILPNGFDDRKLFHARRAIELRRSFYGPKHELVAKDMFYLYVMRPPEMLDRPGYLLDAIEMMRETNPENLNLPYMIEDFTARIYIPKYSSEAPAFSSELARRTNRDLDTVAIEMMTEADRVFRLHYKEMNSAIAANHCRLAYVQVRSGRIAESKPNEQVCRSGLSMLDPKSKEAYRPLLEELDRAHP